MEVSGRLLHEARTRAGLSQCELARRAAVPQSVISEYEAGRRQPSVPTLSKLISATGPQMLVGLVVQGGLRLSTSRVSRHTRSGSARASCACRSSSTACPRAWSPRPSASVPREVMRTLRQPGGWTACHPLDVTSGMTSA